MGCGASSQQAEPAPQETGPAPLTCEERNAIAVEGLKDAMKWALDQSIQITSDVAAWADEELKIRIPVQDKIDSAMEKAAGIPLVGGGLVDALKAATDPFEEAFADAGKSVSANDKTGNCFMKVITSIDVGDAIALCRSGGVTACVDYVKEKGSAAVREAMVSVVDEVMKEHTLTSVWGKFIDKFNSIASKAPGLEPIEFNLNEYVLDKALDAIFIVMMRKEKEIRNAPGQAVSAAVRQAFGTVDPSQWKRN